MSTEHQQYSIANQSAAIALYAAAHNIGIVRSFVDEGKSGTSKTLGRRSGQRNFDLLKKLRGEGDCPLPRLVKTDATE
jgi:DNA invertase Pin-like site-specific DNA recombinase